MSFERFQRLARPGTLVPVWADTLLDTDTPVSAFAKLRRGPFAFLLESAPAGGETWARYTYLGTEPRAAWRLVDGVVEDWTPDHGWHGRRTPQDPISDLQPLELDPSAPPAVGESSYERAKFERDVERIKEYIRAGDCFQALLARRIKVPLDFDSMALYRALRAINPSPYMYHLVLDGVELVGSSPELLVRVSNRRVVVRPIAGTM